MHVKYVDFVVVGDVWGWDVSDNACEREWLL